MECTTCHNPHGSQNVKMLREGNSINEACATCHAESAARSCGSTRSGRENCVTCHDPHGSNNERMLVAKEPMLCQRCHVRSRHPATIYDQTPDQQPEQPRRRTRLRELSPDDPRVESPDIWQSVHAVTPEENEDAHQSDDSDWSASAGLDRPCAGQDQQQQTTTAAQTRATPASSFIPKYGQVDFGYRGDSISGDEARYNRFRDLRQGAFVDRFRLEKETDTWFCARQSEQRRLPRPAVLRRVQAIGKLKLNAEWNQIPLFISNSTASLYTHTGNGVLAIDNAIQQTLQNATLLGTAPRDLAIRNALTTQARQFDMRSRRDVGAFNLVYTLNRDVDVKFNVKNTHRTGFNLMSFGFGTSPGLNPAIEMGVPMDDRTTDIKGQIEFANTRGLLSAGYNGSWFDNAIPTVRFDNPLRATDIINGPSVGQAIMWPTNSSFSVNVNGSYKLPARTRASALISVGRWSQDETIAPPSVNTALVSPPLERATAEDARADIVSMVYSLNSSPVKNVWLNAKCPLLRLRQQDAALRRPAGGDRRLGGHHAEPRDGAVQLQASHAGSRRVVHAVRVAWRSASATAGRTRIARSASSKKTAEDTFRVTMDSTGNDSRHPPRECESSRRSGSGFEARSSKKWVSSR